MLCQLASHVLLVVIPVQAASSVSLLATPTIPASVASVQEVNSIFATASTAPDADNPGSIKEYPLCAQICNNETIAVNLISGDTNDISVLCGPEVRGLTAGCQAATCDSDEQTRTNILSQQFCGSLYDANATYSSEVSVAVASATALANAATQGKDPADVANYPACAAAEVSSPYASVKA
ncbi:MAG: hypothetical protein Q9209_000832 [Squamulea sp. 1 TL-2023]